jgi:hypothetical protein
VESDTDSGTAPRGTTQLTYYKDISYSDAAYTWTRTAMDEEGKGPIYYLQITGGGDPEIVRPKYLTVDGSWSDYRCKLPGGTSYYVDIQSLNPKYRSLWTYGDAAEDALGYETIYIKPETGVPISSMKIEIAGIHNYTASNYSWVASSGTGTNEYFLAKQDGTVLDAAFDEPYRVATSYSRYADKGTVESLADGEWGYGQAAGAADSLNGNTIYFRSDAGDPDALSLFLEACYSYQLYASDYKWNQVGATNEWYMTTSAGGDPGLSKPVIVDVDEYTYTEGTVTSLAPQEWGYANSGGVGFSTLYIYRTSSPDGAVGTGDKDETKPVKVVIRDTAAAYNHYLVNDVQNDNILTIYGEAAGSTSETIPTFYYNHNPFRSDYKLNIQPYTSGIIYCSPYVGDGVKEKDISGPFYAGLQQGDWKYEHSSKIDSTYNGTGDPDAGQPRLATNGSSYMQVHYYDWANAIGSVPSDDYATIAHTYSINGDDSWSRYGTASGSPHDGYLSVNGNSNGDEPIMFGSIQAAGTKYIAGATMYEDDKPGFAYSTDSFGLVWLEKGDSGYEWATPSVILSTEYYGICAAANGSALGRVVCLYHRQSDDRVVVRYTDDSGGTFNDTNIGGNTYITDGDKNTQVWYRGGQFIIVVADGIYYGDGTSFTKKGITGATEIKSVDYGGDGVWAAVESTDAKVWTTRTITDTWVSHTIPKTVSSTATNWVTWDDIGERWIIHNKNEVYSIKDFYEEVDADVAAGTADTVWTVMPIEFSRKKTAASNLVQDVSGLTFCICGEADLVHGHFAHVLLERFSYYWWDVEKFVPISEDYRANTFSVLDGYTVLIGTSEREWEHVEYFKTENPTPSPAIDGTENDFTFTLSTLGDDNGIVPESVNIKVSVTDADVSTTETETITDNGSGVLNGNISATGTINYTTGTVRIIFNTLTIKNATTIGVTYKYYMQGITTGWTFYPRRVRWSAPMTYNDFEGVGSGTADANGSGAFVDSRPVNGRIVVFETNRISSVVPRGDVNDPWDFDIIQEDIRILSNPVVVDDFCYFISSDGLLWKTDGINADEAGASFDLTEFDDFSESKPVMLDFSRSLNSLLVYYFDPNDTTPTCSVISLATGSVTKMDLPVMSDSGGLSEEPKNVFAVSDSSDQRTMVSYHPLSADDDAVVVSPLNAGGGITGKDLTVSSGQDGSYWYSTIETGELFIAPEGNKSSIRHLIVNTYTEADGTNTYRPYIAVEMRSLEDAGWKSNGDDVGTATMTDSGLTGSGTAWSNTIVVGTAAAGEVGPYTLPCLGSQARVYKDSTLQVEDTDYTVSGKTITLTTGLTNGEVLYAYWENYPEIRVAVGDYFKSSEGFHQVTAVTTSTAITCDHYLSTGSETVTHYPAVQMPDGEGETKIGIRKLVEGVRVRLYVIPDYDSSNRESESPKIVKIILAISRKGERY